MHRLTKVHPSKTVLEDISLSFCPARRSACSGSTAPGNPPCCGSWPAGHRVPRRRDVDPDATVGLLEQEPQLDEAKDVRGNVEDGVAEQRALFDRFNELASTTPTRRRTSSPSSRTRSTRPTPGTSTRRSRSRWTRCACRRGDADVTKLSGGERRRVALCRLLLRAARPAAPRRADQPPRRRDRRLARAPPRRIPGHGRRRDPRPVLPRQRRRLDPRARPRPRHPLQGQLLVAGSSRSRRGCGRRSTRRTRASARSRASSSGRA